MVPFKNFWGYFTDFWGKGGTFYLFSEFLVQDTNFLGELIQNLRLGCKFLRFWWIFWGYVINFEVMMPNLEANLDNSMLCYQFWGYIDNFFSYVVNFEVNMKILRLEFIISLFSFRFWGYVTKPLTFPLHWSTLIEILNTTLFNLNLLS